MTLILSFLLAFVQGTIVIQEESAIDSTGASEAVVSLVFPCPGGMCQIEVKS